MKEMGAFKTVISEHSLIFTGNVEHVNVVDGVINCCCYQLAQTMQQCTG